jgi:hypothetical protein
MSTGHRALAWPSRGDHACCRRASHCTDRSRTDQATGHYSLIASLSHLAKPATTLPINIRSGTSLPPSATHLPPPRCHTLSATGADALKRTLCPSHAARRLKSMSAVELPRSAETSSTICVVSASPSTAASGPGLASLQPPRAPHRTHATLLTSPINDSLDLRSVLPSPVPFGLSAITMDHHFSELFFLADPQN